MEIFFAPAETVTSAVRHAQPLELSPSAVTVITREDIETSGARSLSEVLRLVPNMDVYMVTPLWYALGVRSDTTISSNTMLLLVDGRDVTMEFFGFPLWAVNNFSMDDVERIEVIRGPGSALYGANAFSGVVNVVTRKPGDGPRASVSIRGGERGQTELACSATEKFGPLALRVSAGFDREDFWTSRDTEARETIRGRIGGKIDLGSENGLLLEMGLHSGVGKFHTNIGEADISRGTNLYGMARLDYADLMVQAVYDRYVFDAEFDLVLDYMGLKLAQVPPADAVANKANFIVQHAVEVFHNRVAYGAEYVLSHSHSSILLDPADQQPDPDKYEHRIGLFVQDEVNIGAILAELAETSMPPLILTAGLRFDENSVTRWEISPRASLVCTPIENHSFRMGYAHAFLKPTFFESSLTIRLDDISNMGFTWLDISNPDLDNETIDSLEVGYHGSFLDDSLILKLDLAYNWYRNTISFDYDLSKLGHLEIGPIRVPDINGPGLNFYNSPTGRNGHNMELQIIARPSERSRVFFQAGYRQIFDAASGAFDRSEPVWRMAAGADLSGTAGWTLSMRAFYCASRELFIRSPLGVLEPIITVEVPEYWLLNARLAWSIMSEPLQMTAGIEAFNLLGFGFREFAGISMDNRYDWGAERLGRRFVLFLHGQL